MQEPTPADFWYAVQHTRVVRPPRQTLETFGATMLSYHLVTEPMDEVGVVRVREGRIEAQRPELILPNHLTQDMLDGFGEQAQAYADWLQQHGENLALMQYGFKVSKQELSHHLVHASPESVVEQINADLDARDDPLCALVVGVDEPWEVCLFQLMVEVVQSSSQKNALDLMRDPGGLRGQLEQEFQAAARDRSRLGHLAEFLRKNNLFDEYQDQFFALVHK